MYSAAAVAVCLALLLPASSASVEEEAADYLTKFGYVETDDGTGELENSIDFVGAIKKFQDYAGLEKTGELDQETKDLMKTPRCGLDDRVANFVQEGSIWQKRELSYRISKYPSSSSISKEDVDLQVMKAFSMWQEASELKFEERSTGTVEIDIRFEQTQHGDGIPFDGPRGQLAHAFYPSHGGDVHVDDSENWSITPYEGDQLLATLTHELGHSLGLMHSNAPGSIMAPFYKGWNPDYKLGQDDIRGIGYLYGKITGNIPGSYIPRGKQPGTYIPRGKEPRGKQPRRNTPRGNRPEGRGYLPVGYIPRENRRRGNEPGGFIPRGTRTNGLIPGGYTPRGRYPWNLFGQ